MALHFSELRGPEVVAVWSRVCCSWGKWTSTFSWCQQRPKNEDGEAGFSFFPSFFFLPDSLIQITALTSFFRWDNALELMGLSGGEDPLPNSLAPFWILRASSPTICSQTLKGDSQTTSTFGHIPLLIGCFCCLPQQIGILNSLSTHHFKFPLSLLCYLNFSYISISWK